MERTNLKALPFDPAKAKYDSRWIPSKTRKDSTRRLNGPYWYAIVKTDDKPKTYYLGKELPDECKPYAEIQEATASPTVSPAFDNLRRALERGNQVIIDIGLICRVCNAEWMPITPSKFLLYRED